MLSWFTKPKVEIDTVVAQPTPLEQYEQNRAALRVLDQQLRAAELAINEHIRPRKDPRFAFLFRGGKWSMQTRIGAMFMDPTLQKLEWNRSEILRKRADTLAEHARLKQLCGMATYSGGSDGR